VGQQDILSGSRNDGPHNVTSQYLCFSTDLTSGEAAAWFQAWGSIVAILGAFLIASYQLRKQHTDALALEEKRRRVADLDVARTLAELTKRSWQTAGFLRAQLVDRATVHEIASGQQHLELGMLRYFEMAVLAIPLHALPHRLLIYPPLVESCLRQMRAKIGMALRVHTTMDAAAFSDLFKTLDDMVESLRKTREELEEVVKKME
jgi:hypothetical protein